MHTTPAPTAPITVAGAGDRLLRLLSAPLELRTWTATGYNLVGLLAGLVWSVVIASGLVLGAGLALTLVGIPLLVVVLLVARAGAWTERWRAGWVGDRPGAPTPPRPATFSWAGFWAQLTHLRSWTSALYLVLLLPVGIATFTVAVTSWTFVVAALTSPLWNGTAAHARLLGFSADRPVDQLAIVAAGALGVFLAPWINRGAAVANVALVRLLAAGADHSSEPATTD